MKEYLRSSAIIWFCIVGVMCIGDAIEIWALGRGEPAWSPVRNLLATVIQSGIIGVVHASIAGAIIRKVSQSRRALATVMSWLCGVILGAYFFGWAIAVTHYGFAPQFKELVIGLAVIPLVLGTIVIFLVKMFSARSSNLGRV